VLPDEERIAAARRAAFEYLKHFRDAVTCNDRDDLAQEVVLILLRDAPQLRDPHRLEAFSRTVARRLRCRRLAQQWRQRTFDIDGVAPAFARQATELRLGAGLRVPRDWLFARLEEALAVLPPLSGRLVRARYEGFCCAEISARYELPVQAVKRRLHRARERLRRLLLRAFERAGDEFQSGTGPDDVHRQGGNDR
jgi:RNA polymerase sigma factor (sigma-70 family)